MYFWLWIGEGPRVDRRIRNCLGPIWGFGGFGLIGFGCVLEREMEGGWMDQRKGG